MRSGVGSRSAVSMSPNAGAVVPSMRSAFCSASSKLRPIAITSPTDFIDEPMPGSAPRNFCRSQRGALTTT